MGVLQPLGTRQLRLIVGLLVLGSTGLVLALVNGSESQLALDLAVAGTWAVVCVALVRSLVRAARAAEEQREGQALLDAVGEARRHVLRDENPRSAVVEAVARVTGARLAVLSEPEHGALRTTAIAGGDFDLVLPLDQPSVAGRVFTEGTPVHLRNLKDETDAAVGLLEGLERLLETEIHSVTYVPVVVQGTSVGVLSAAFEVTDERRAEHALPILELLAGEVAVAIQRERLLAEAEAGERWRAALISSLAHDVRSPLTSIVGVLDLMSESADPDARRLVASAQRQAQRIARLADGLLDNERVEAGTLRLDLTTFSVWELLQGVVADTGHGLDHDIEIHADASLSALADRARVEQVLHNLLSNASRYGRPPVHLRARIVTTAATGRELEISVRDHGTGVPAPRVAHLFQRFSGGAASPTDHAQSVGLGLWIVSMLAHAHGGRTTYRACEPGACFTLHLPQ
ncbi:sensor histidine kinase [Nocardioides scoriae]|nr:ATP-binding protein [Nocardioides scoriae]